MNEYVISVLEMEPGSCLALCDEARQMAKNITKRGVKGLLTSVPMKALGQCALLKKVTPLPLEVPVLW